MQIKPTEGVKIWWAMGMGIFLFYTQKKSKDGTLAFSEKVTAQLPNLTKVSHKLNESLKKDKPISFSEWEYRALVFALNYAAALLLTDEGVQWFSQEYYPTYGKPMLHAAFTTEEALTEYFRFSEFFFKKNPPVNSFAKIKEEVKAEIEQMFGET